MKPLSKRLRFEVFKRDSFTCQYCGKAAPQVVLHVDHIEPRSKGGQDKITNLVTSCVDCNLGKSDKRLSDDSAVQKAKKQADLLQERRNQIEMMSKWYQELESLQEQEVDLVERRIGVSGIVLSELGRKNMRARIKKYGLSLVLEKAGEAFSEFTEGTESYEACVAKLDKLLKWDSIPFYVQRAQYITGVIRNRFKSHYGWFENFKRFLIHVLKERPSEHSEFYSIAANAADPAAARDEMIDLTESLGMDADELIEKWNK